MRFAAIHTGKAMLSHAMLLRPSRGDDPDDVSDGHHGKFFLPLPECGLRKRLHRVRFRALAVLGGRARVVSPEYAAEFGARVHGGDRGAARGWPLPTAGTLDTAGSMITDCP
jgi:hypothetical protein